MYSHSYSHAHVVIPKVEVEVAVGRSDGTITRGAIFVRSDERVVDRLNSEEDFVPLSQNDGAVLLLSKDAIVTIEPFDDRRMDERYVPLEQRAEKSRKRVILHKTDGCALRGCVFIFDHQRVLDLLNDSRWFVPFQTDEGRFHLVNKRVIAAIEQREQMTNRTHPSLSLVADNAPALRTA
jgi:hypothetical protein